MKKYTILAVILAACLSARADTTASTPSTVQVTVQSDAKDLAKGYAAAFAALTNTPFTLLMQKEGVVRQIEDVKAVKASEGVVIVTTGKNLNYIVNPMDIICIAEGRPMKVLPNGG
ncbi:MAG TPA: hypothetical protein VMI53_04970 [Opitutaceae bacterium]|nr:hypothetical protein [Opitutaceae bacterium]